MSGQDPRWLVRVTGDRASAPRILCAWRTLSSSRGHTQCKAVGRWAGSRSSWGWPCQPLCAAAPLGLARPGPTAQLLVALTEFCRHLAGVHEGRHSCHTLGISCGPGAMSAVGPVSECPPTPTPAQEDAASVGQGSGDNCPSLQPEAPWLTRTWVGGLRPSHRLLSPPWIGTVVLGPPPGSPCSLPLPWAEQAVWVP